MGAGSASRATTSPSVNCYIHNTGGEGAGGLLTNSLFEDNVLDHCTFLGDNSGGRTGA